MNYIKDIVTLAIFVSAFCLFVTIFTPFTEPLVYITSAGGLLLVVTAAFFPLADPMVRYLILYIGLLIVWFIAPFYVVLRPHGLPLQWGSLCTLGMLILTFLIAWYVIYKEQGEGAFDLGYHMLLMLPVFVYGYGLAWLCKYVHSLAFPVQ